MTLSLKPARLRQYKEIARLLYKYGRKDLVARAGLERALEDEAILAGEAAEAHELATDLFFLVAAGGALWLAFDILRSDQPHSKH